jgi:serine/threonine protein kinase
MENTSRYEIIDANHGEGGFGKISKQRDKVLDRIVAVKQLRLLNDAEARERFLREAKTLARLNHPNVPAIYDIKYDDAEMFIYFAFVEGRALREHVQAETVPSLDLTRRWFTQVAAALDHAHSKGIVHRDVKPDNIIIAHGEDNATIVDFGIALTADDVKKLTKVGYAIGTPAYMSPEQANGEDLDKRSDIYSLGITLYETLAGHLPNAGGYQPISDSNEAIPPAIDDLIKQCLVPERNGRIQSAADFIRALRSAFRTDVPLSTLLVDARLHELVASLRQLSAEDFSAKPRGQKLLMVNRLKDLLRTDRPELRNATADVIELLTRIARLEGESEYRPICAAAFSWGFDRNHYQHIRDAIIESAKAATRDGHHVLSSEFLKFIGTIELTNKRGWYAHDIRLIAMSLLANPTCGKEADELAAVYDAVNAASH